jgi:hypothetical protein
VDPDVIYQLLKKEISSPMDIRSVNALFISIIDQNLDLITHKEQIRKMIEYIRGYVIWSIYWTLASRRRCRLLQYIPDTVIYYNDPYVIGYLGDHFNNESDPLTVIGLIDSLVDRPDRVKYLDQVKLEDPVDVLAPRYMYILSKYNRPKFRSACLSWIIKGNNIKTLLSQCLNIDNFVDLCNTLLTLDHHQYDDEICKILSDNGYDDLVQIFKIMVK